MNYIAIVNNFWNLAPSREGYKADHAALFFAIVDSINRNEWNETEIEYDRLFYKVKMWKRTYLQCRKWLVENGFIALKEGRGEYSRAKFWIGRAVLDAVSNSTAVDTAVPDSTAYAVSGAVLDSTYLNKTINNNIQTNKPSRENFSNAPVKGFEKKAPPVAAAPPIQQSLRVIDWDHAATIICRSEEARRLGMKAVQATGQGGMYSEFSELVADFIEGNKMVCGDILPWKTEKELRSHFQKWLPKYIPMKAERIRNAAAHQKTGRPAGGPTAGRKFTPTLDDEPDGGVQGDEWHPARGIIQLD